MLQHGPVELGTQVSLGRSPRVSLELFVGRQSNTRHQGSVLVFHQPPGPVQVHQVQMPWYKGWSDALQSRKEEGKQGI